MIHTQSCLAGVCSILDYAANLWGFKELPKINKDTQNRTIRSYLGVHKYAPNQSIQGNMGQPLSCVKVVMVRFWNCLTRMDDDRLFKKILLSNIVQNKNCWVYEIWEIMKDANYEDVYHNLETVHESACQMYMKGNVMNGKTIFTSYLS